MDSFVHKTIDYFNFHLQTVIKFRCLIRQIEISARPWENYGRNYYLVEFKISLHEDYKILLPSEQVAEAEDRLINNFDEVNPPVGFLIQGLDLDGIQFGRDQYFKRLKEFIDSYSVLSIFITAFISEFAPDIKLIVHTLDRYPEVTHLKLLWSNLLFQEYLYENCFNISFTNDVELFAALYTSGQTTTSLKNRTLIKDQEICAHTRIQLYPLRKYILEHKIPFCVDANKTINSILIDLLELSKVVHAMPMTAFPKEQHERLKAFLDKKINETELQENKNKKYPIKENEYIYFKTGSIGKVTSIKFDNDKVCCSYRLLNKDLSIGHRMGECDPSETVLKKLSVEEFESFESRGKWLSRYQLENYIKAHIKKIDWDLK